MDDLGINKWLLETYGTTVDFKPLFRVIWSTGITEFRRSRFIDHVGDIEIRDVVETREVLKYPFAQDRWILERIAYIGDDAREVGLQTDDRFTYHEIFVFQDGEGNYLPLNKQAVEILMYTFFNVYLKLTPIEKVDLQMARLAKIDKQKRNEIRDKLGEGSSAINLVIDSNPLAKSKR